MTDMLNIAIVDDHPLVREGVVHVVDADPHLTVVNQGETAQDAIDIVSRDAPDILILDLSIPGTGVHALREIKTQRPQTLVLILTVSDDEAHVYDLLAQGADGYMLKGSSGSELIYALRMLARGEQYVTPHLAVRMLSEIALTKSLQAAASLDDLTERERSIAEMVAEQHSNKVIGNMLGLSEKTIKHYLTIVFRKADVANRQALAEWVLKQSNDGR